MVSPPALARRRAARARDLRSAPPRTGAARAPRRPRAPWLIALALAGGATGLAQEAPAQAPAAATPVGDDLAYRPDAPVGLAWLDADTLAVVDGGPLRVVTFGGERHAPVVVERRTLAGRFAPPIAAAGAAAEAGLLLLSGDAVVQLDAGLAEVARYPAGGGAQLVRHLALGAGGRAAVGDGTSFVTLLGARPRPIALQDPAPFQAMAFTAPGELLLLPDGRRLDLAAGTWSAGPPTSWSAGRGANRIAYEATSDLLATFRRERPLELVRRGDEGAVAVDLGYRHANDLAVDPDGTLALVAFAGRATLVQEAGDDPTTPAFGALELHDLGAGALVTTLDGRGAALGFDEAPEHRTMAVGLRAVAVGGGRFATLDLVDEAGKPRAFLRLRGRDLVATAEAPVDGTFPVHLEAGGGLLAVVVEEVSVAIHALEDLDAGELAPRVTIDISPQEDPITGASVPPRDVWALAPDGSVLAMTGADGSVFFADPGSGYPHPAVSVQLPRGCGRPLAARFEATGELVVTAQAAGEPVREWTLGTDFQRWGEPVEVPGVEQRAGAHRVGLRRGAPGDLDVRRGLDGALLLRAALGLEAADALAVSAGGRVALAAGGRLQLFALPADAPRGAEGRQPQPGSGER